MIQKKPNNSFNLIYTQIKQRNKMKYNVCRYFDDVFEKVIEIFNNRGKEKESTMKNNDIIHDGRTSSMDADAPGGVTSGWDTSTPDQILENLETWKNRVQNEKGFLGDSGPLDRFTEARPGGAKD